MTHSGMPMLHNYTTHPDRWYVPPLELVGGKSDKVTLLEVMPGAVLERVEFEGVVGKGYKNAKNAFVNRDLIIRQLADISDIELEKFSDIRLAYMANDDCLDSVIVLVMGALWVCRCSDFVCPDDGDELAQLEV